MPVVPALPDTERRTSYTVVSASVGPFDTAFDIYGDDDDFEQWIEVWLDGEKQVGNWTLTSATSADLSILPRPITDAEIEFDSAITGNLQIVGARRPRRAQQFTEGVSVKARDHNRAYSDITATQREFWDKFLRTPQLPPGEVSGPLPSLADLEAGVLGVVNGEWTAFAAQLGYGNVLGPNGATDNAIVRFNGVSGYVIQNSLVTISDDGDIVGPATAVFNASTRDASDLPKFSVGNSTTLQTINGSNYSNVYFGIQPTGGSNLNARWWYSSIGSALHPYVLPGSGTLAILSSYVNQGASTYTSDGHWFNHNLYAGTGDGGTSVRAEISLNGTWSASGAGSGGIAILAKASTSRGGTVWAINPYVLVTAAAIEACAVEANTDVQAATTNKIGIQVVDKATSTGTISGENVAFRALANTGAYKFLYAFTLGASDGTSFPVRTTGTLFKSFGSSTVASGIDISSLTITTSAFKSTNFEVTGAGAISAASLILTAPLPLASGGTAASLTANNGGIFYSTATAGAILAGTATANQMLQSGATAAPAWSTSRWPATTVTNEILYSGSTNLVQGLASANSGVLVTSATGQPSILAGSGVSNNILISSASGTPSWTTAQYPSTTTANNLLYSGSANLVQNLATANNGVLVTSSGGVPSISSTIPSATQDNITRVGTLVSGATGAGFTVALGTSTLTGDLPFANLTQGSARSVLGVTGNATADFASIQGSAGQILSVPAAGTSLVFTATPVLGTSGTTGALGFAGTTSGTATITPQATAGTPTLTLPNASGTFAVSVSVPLALSATTGNLTITGAAGQVLAGSTPAFTATPVLGVAGSTVGTLGFQNATSGTITLSPVAGALGTVTLSLPARTDTLVTLAGSEALTGKTYNGNTWTAGTGTLTIAAGKTATHNATTTFAGTDGKTLTISNTLTLTATDGSTLAIGAGGTLASAAYVATGTSGATIPLLNGNNTWSGANNFANTLTASFVDGNIALNCTNAGGTSFIRFQDASTNKFEFGSQAATTFYCYDYNVGQFFLHYLGTGSGTLQLMETAGGVTVGAPTGGSMGNGTLNAKAVYDDSVLLTDYVFDKFVGRERKYTDAVQKKFDGLDPAMFTPAGYGAFWKEHGKLFDMPDVDDCIDGLVKMPLGMMAHRLMQTDELQAIHIDNHEQRIAALESRPH